VQRREETIEYLDPSEIKPDPNQPRQTWTDEDRKEIESMVESLKEHGVIEPIEVDENNVIILGERRWKACKIAKVKVPVRRKIGLKPQERFERQIIADSQRKELSPMDRAWAFATAIANINTGKNYTVKQVKVMDKNQIQTFVFNPKGRGHDEVGQAEFNRRTGISQQIVSVYLKNIGLEKQVQEAIDKQKLPITIGREITKLEEPKLEKELQKTILREAEEKKPRRDEVHELVSFVKKPEVEIPFTKEKVVVDLSDKDKSALIQKKTTPDEIKVREISKRLQPSSEAQEKIRQAIQKTKEEIQKIKEIPEVKERGKWYQNWLAHGALAEALQGAFCPVCGSSDSLGWLCHNLKLVDAYTRVTKEYEKRMK
jgi:ParB-like chromosome segregation protein Spo0J